MTKRILVIEDEPQMLLGLRDNLELEGYEVLTAADGEEGLAIVDHVMRGHGGFVRVNSDPGRGSTFSLHFPLYAGDLGRDETHTGDRGRAADVARSA